MMGILRPLNSVQIYSLLHQFPQWAHLSQTGNVSGQQVNGEINLLNGGKTADAEPNRRVRQVFPYPYGPENVRGLQGCRSAGRSARDGNVLQSHQQGLPLHVGERNIQAPLVS